MASPGRADSSSSRIADQVPCSPSASCTSPLARYRKLEDASPLLGSRASERAGTEYSDSEAGDEFTRGLFYMHPGSSILDAAAEDQHVQRRWTDSRRPSNGLEMGEDDADALAASSGMQIHLSFDGSSSQAGEMDADPESSEGGEELLRALGLGELAG